MAMDPEDFKIVDLLEHGLDVLAESRFRAAAPIGGAVLDVLVAQTDAEVHAAGHRLGREALSLVVEDEGSPPRADASRRYQKRPGGTGPERTAPREGRRPGAPQNGPHDAVVELVLETEQRICNGPGVQSAAPKGPTSRVITAGVMTRRDRLLPEEGHREDE